MFCFERAYTVSCINTSIYKYRYYVITVAKVTGYACAELASHGGPTLAVLRIASCALDESFIIVTANTELYWKHNIFISICYKLLTNCGKVREVAGRSAACLRCTSVTVRVQFVTLVDTFFCVHNRGGYGRRRRGCSSTK